MADYIYLMQNRLTPAQWRALEAVREAARSQGMPVFLIGGAVRDLTTGTPVRDLDFALQGDPALLLEELTAKGAKVSGRDEALGSLYLTFRGGVRVEVGQTLRVQYPKPGVPETEPAAILDDLRHRDFTANAMAVSLNEGSYGLLLDPMNGAADIENRELRLVSAYGFIEQPALLLRAARLGERLGWSLEERTGNRYENSKEEDHIAALAPQQRSYELEEIFHEEDPVATMEQMAAEGWLKGLLPELDTKDADRSGLDAVRDLLGQMETLGLHPDPSAINFPLLTAKLSEPARKALKARFAKSGFVEQIDSVEGRAKELAAQITSKSSAQPSDTWKLLIDADPEALLWLAYHSRSGAVQGKIKAFLGEWPQVRSKIPYALMQEMRITPDLPGYEQLLDALFFALIDGKLDTPEAARAFLEPYSPPAPPQVNVRRRAAKSTRSRSKRAASAEAVETEADTDTEIDAEDEGKERSKAPAAPVAGTSAGSGDPEVPAAEAAGKPAAKKGTSPKKAAAAKPVTPTAKEETPAVPKPGASGRSSAAADKEAAHPAPAEKKKADSAKAQPAAKKSAPSKASVAAPKKAPAKQLAKPTAKAPVKTATKKVAEVKGVASKTSSTSKGQPAKKTGSKPASKAVVAKKSAPPAKTAKKTVTAKAAQKKAPATSHKSPSGKHPQVPAKKAATSGKAKSASTKAKSKR